MKLVFNTENKTVELQNENNEVVDFWKAESEKAFFFSKNSIVDYIAVYIAYYEEGNLFFCNSKRMKTNDSYEICKDSELVKYFMVDAPIINDYYKAMRDKENVKS